MQPAHERSFATIQSIQQRQDSPVRLTLLATQQPWEGQRHKAFFKGWFAINSIMVAGQSAINHAPVTGESLSARGQRPTVAHLPGIAPFQSAPP